MICKGDTVKFRCRGFLENGQPIDSDEDDTPMVMKAGLEKGSPIGVYISKALIGMKVNDTKAVAVPAKDAFGEYNPDLRMALPRSRFPEQIGLGDVLELTFEKAGKHPELREANVVKVSATDVEVDMNHQLAGESLVFRISVLDVEQGRRAS